MATKPSAAWRCVISSISRIAAACGLLWFAVPLQAGDLEALQARAAELDLAERSAWRALLHYEADWVGDGVTSTATTSWFFLSGHGRTDPEAELAATLAAFAKDSQVAARELPARCVFVARYRFLAAHLDLEGAGIAPPDCEAFRRWRAGLDAESLSLIFPAAYLNNPASMFGHTLLRIDGEGARPGGELLSYAVNFAAGTDDDPGIAFAYKGLTGGYPGVYGVFPYYEKVKQYAWIENRDVWDYPLALDEDEIERVVAHLWELRGVAFDYYFINKNCSYQLLALLEAARPSLRLTERFDWYAIPADTIRALRADTNLLGRARFRPSLHTQLRHRHGRLSPEQAGTMRALAAGRLAPDAPSVAALRPRTRARVLEVAADVLQYRIETDAAPASAASARRRAILRARSRVDAASGFPPVPRPATAPDAGHRSRRVRADVTLSDGRASLGLQLRLAYHDLLDPPGGYLDGAAVTVGELGLRLDPRANALAVDRFTLLGIESLSTRDALFRPVSWRLETGMRRRPLALAFGDEAGEPGYFIEGGAGLAWGELGRLAGYGLALGSLDAGEGFREGYGLGVGGAAGLLVSPREGWRLRLEAGALDYVGGDGGRRRWVELGQQWPLSEGLALRAVLGWQSERGAHASRAVLALNGHL